MTSSVEQLLWGGAPAPARGPRRGLTLDGIATAAVRVADRDGLAGLSMQKVADEVGLTKMALYRYVAGKPELQAVMIDAAVEEPPDVGRMLGTWRDHAEEFARRLSDVWTRHPWLPWATVGRRLMGPREVGWVEAAVHIFEPLGLEPDEHMEAVTLLFGHLRTTHAAAATGTRPWTAAETSLRDLVVSRDDRYPALARVMAAAPAPTSADPPHYRFGLSCLLDGLEAAVRDRRKE